MLDYQQLSKYCKLQNQMVFPPCKFTIFTTNFQLSGLFQKYFSIQSWGSLPFPIFVYLGEIKLDAKMLPLILRDFPGKKKVHGLCGLVSYFITKKTLGGGFKYFLVSPVPGEMIQFDEHIFQMGWFNHQPEKLRRSFLPRRAMPMSIVVF